MRASLFAGEAQTLDLASRCWMLRGKLRAPLRPSDSDREQLWAAQPKERESFMMYGRRIAMPRYVTLFSQQPLSVSVAGNDIPATVLGAGTPSYLQRLLESIAGGHNSIVTNWYPSGDDYIGWHGDREKQIDADAPIISVSLGPGSRRFQVRDESSNRIVFNEVLEDGDCIVMGGPGFQQKFKHRVPKMIAKKDGLVQKRMNLTVRKYDAGIAKKARANVRSEMAATCGVRSPASRQGKGKAKGYPHDS